MKIFFSIFIGSVIGLLICLYFQENKVEKKTTRILWIGDSLTASGYYVKSFNDIAKENGVKIQSTIKAKAGSQVQFVEDTLMQEDLSQYDYVSILSGINLIDKPEKVIHTLEKSYVLIKQKNPNAKIIAISLLPFGQYETWTTKKQSYLLLVNYYIEWNSNVTSFINAYDGLKINRTDMNPAYTTDGLHLNKNGGRHLAEIIWKQISAKE